jgi:PAS domain S-box-containing protein
VSRSFAAQHQGLSQAGLLARSAALTRAAAIVSVTVGCVVLVGWLFDLEYLKSVIPGLVSMKANTAIGFILAGLSLWLLRTEAFRSASHSVNGAVTGSALALVVVVLGASTMSEWIFDWNLGIDQLLFTEPADTVGTTVPGRMAPTTAFSFVMAGLSLLLLNRKRATWMVQASCLMMALVSMLAVVSYAYRLGDRWQLATLMAFPTAIAFCVLAAGVLLARPGRGLMRVVLSESAGGTLARRSLPAAVLVPLVLGWLRLRGQYAGLYGTEFGLAMMTTLTMGILGGLIWWNASFAFRMEETERRADEELRESEQRFRATFEHAAIGFALVAPDGRWLHVNDKICGIAGYTREELLGLTFQDITHPEDLDADLDLVGRVLAGEIETYSLEKRCIRKDRSIVFINQTVSLVRDERGEPRYFIAAIEDISGRKRAEVELRQLNATLESRVASRTAELQHTLREVESFSYSVSHDLRAPLRAIEGFSGILTTQHAAELSAGARQSLQRVRDNAKQMGRLIDDLLTLSLLSRQAMRLETVSHGALVGNCLELLQPELDGRSVEIVIGDLPECEGDAGLLKLVWMNLLSNAVKFTRKREAARIEVGCRRNGESVYFVRDNGVGFKVAFADKLFAAFQRLHSAEEYEGTGVGLATVERIVRRHGGRVWAEAELDHGATFHFTLEPETT